MLFLSIRPTYVEKIFQGDKQVELRRRRPRTQPGEWIAVYSTSPVMHLVGVVQVQEVRVKSPESLWRGVRSISGVTRQEFMEYFEDSPHAVGIMIQDPIPLSKPVPLAELKEYWKDFHPPQGFRYLSGQQIEFVWGRVNSKARRRLAA